jgi:hypothetical protein
VHKGPLLGSRRSKTLQHHPLSGLRHACPTQLGSIHAQEQPWVACQMQKSDHRLCVADKPDPWQPSWLCCDTEHGKVGKHHGTQPCWCLPKQVATCQTLQVPPAVQAADLPQQNPVHYCTHRVITLRCFQPPAPNTFSITPGPYCHLTPRQQENSTPKLSHAE